MSTARHSRRATGRGVEYVETRPREIAELRARRRHVERRRRLARVDVGLGLFGALVLVIATPGLAIAGLIAVLVLAACALTLVVQWRRRR